MDLHRLGEERSVAMHAAIAEKVRRDPAIVDRARAKVDEWLARGLLHPVYAERWRAVLALPIDALCERLVARDEHMVALRQATPFVGVLDPRERWTLRRAVTGDP